MELFELRYFLGVARTENIHRAAEILRVSPGSLSKAILRIETELGVKLFKRNGRNIQLTPIGNLIQIRASQLIQLEEALRLEVNQHRGEIRAAIAGSEVFLSEFGLKICRDLKNRHASLTVEFQPADDISALKRVQQGDAHLAIVASEIPRGLTVRTLAQAAFHTVVGKGHALYLKAKLAKVVSIEEVLRYPFASPSQPILGQVGQHQSVDGWRDDQFPRLVKYQANSLKILEALVRSGEAIAYLPDYLVATFNDVAPLKIKGCPYSCHQSIKLVARRPQDIGWLNSLF